MEFSVQGSRVALRGTKTPGVKLITNKALNLAVNHGVEICFLQLNQSTPYFIIPACTLSHLGFTNPTVPMEIELLLKQFKDIFLEPNQLPTSRPGFDHKIPLK